MYKLSLVALASIIVPFTTANTNDTFLLPAGSGPFGVRVENIELVDHSRPDPWNSSHARRIMISRLDPVPKEKCQELTLIPYMPPATAQLESDTYTPFGYPEDIWSQFRLQVCESARCSKEDYPVVIYGPGGGTTRLFYNSLAQEISSHGFIVITVDHPYEVDITEFPNGDIIYGGRVNFPNSPNDTDTSSVVKALDVRAADISFVIDSLRLSEAVVFGHSFGGAASATAMRKDHRIRGGVNLDGAMYGSVIDEGFGSAENRSYILWASSVHNTTSLYNEDWGWGEFWDSIEKEDTIWKREISIRDSRHSGFWDLNMCIDVANLRDLPRTGPNVGSCNGTRTWEILGRFLPAYFRFALGIEEEDDILSHSSREFPEVSILRR